MSTPLDEHFLTIAEKIFPDNARLMGVSDGKDWMILASWRLADPSRPNKRSKTVSVTVPEEAVENYCQSSNGEHRAAQGRFERWLQEHLAVFDPSHDAPLGTEPPQERWLIRTRELNG